MLRYCLVFVICLSFIDNLISYDKIDVASYFESYEILNAQSLEVSNEKVYVLTKDRIYVYTSTLGYISSFSISERNPVSISVYKENIYVLDETECSVNVYNLNGEKRFSFGGCGEGYGQLLSPKYIRIFDNKVFIASFGNSLINIYTDKGVFLYSIPTIANDKKYIPSRLMFDPEGYIYVVDKKNKVIAKYDFNGKFYMEYLKNEFPADITDNGFVYTGSEDGKIREYDLNFTQRGVFGTKGKNKYEFQQFTDIRAYKSGVFILDSKNKKIIYLKIENKKTSVYKRKNFFKEKLTLNPEKIFKLNSKTFLPVSDGIFFYSDKKNEEGFYSYKTDGTVKKIFSYGKGQEQILSSKDIIYYQDRLYILDDSNYKVKVFENGKYLLSFGDKTGFIGGTKEGRFSQPVKMAMDMSEKIYVLDTKLYIIQVFNKDGVFLYSIDLSAYSNTEKFVDLLYDGENIFVLSINKVFIFTPDGKFIRSFELKDISFASSFCYDGRDYLFIVDSEKSRVSVYDRSGNYLCGFLGVGKGDVELYKPFLIRYNDGIVYILDELNRIVSFKVDYFVHPVNFDAVYNSTSSAVVFSFEVDNKNYLKHLFIEKSTDTLNFVELRAIDIDSSILASTTYYYRLKITSISDNISFSEVKTVFVPYFDIMKSTKQYQVTNRPPFEIIPINLDYIFASSYKYYLSNPIGKIIIKNNTADNFENLKFSFFIKEYMDFPYDIVIDKIESGSQKEVNINATLNSKIVAITETTPVQARLTLEYYINSEEKEISLNIPIKILSRNSIVWEDVRRFGSFITIKDPIIYDLARVVASKKDVIKSNVDDNIKVFSLIYNYLSGKAIKYVEDPVSPYKLLRTSYTIIDTVQYPRNILKIRAGDCDDLTALFVSLLEASGIGTLIVDYSDHITGMFELKGQDSYKAGIPRDFLVEYNGRYYIPFEVTMLSKDAFSSISYATNYYKNKKDIAKIYSTREIVSIFEPPTFSEDTSFDTFIPEDVVSKAKNDVELIERKYFEYYENYYLSILKEEPQNYDSMLNLAIIYGFEGKYNEAEKILQEILAKFPEDASALNNLANIYHLTGEYIKAAEYYEKAYKSDPYDVDILINAARNANKMGKNEDAKIILEKAYRINPDIKEIEKEILKEE